MAGIYIHIPFCSKACSYCDFHFSTTQKNKELILSAIKEELKIRKGYVGIEPIQTVYFGGGTPSLLTQEEILSIFDVIYEHYSIEGNAEITLEANPDNLSKNYLQGLKNTPINRLSIGVQSFFEEDLQFMNRSHNATQAVNALQDAQNIDFENITCDLIYGYPLLSDEKWLKNIHTLLGLNIPHISCYSMTVEPKTALENHIRKGKLPPMDEEQSSKQFLTLIQELTTNDFLHYEISNFGKKGYLSQHNSNYWKGIHYIGIGPSAHSFDGKSRQWNISNNHRYTEGIFSSNPSVEREELSRTTLLNEYLMTGLRTMWGIDNKIISERFGDEYKQKIMELSRPFIQKKWIETQNEQLILTSEGKMFADFIATELFFI